MIDLVSGALRMDLEAKSGKAIFVVFFIALFVRLLYIPLALRYDPYLSRDPLLGDGRDYDAIGWNLCAGNGFADQAGELTSRRAPAYPALLALIYCIGGHDLFLARASNALMGALVVVLVFLIARRFFGRDCAVVASLIMSFHPIVIYFGAFVGTEAIFLLVLWSGFFAAIQVADRPSIARLLLLGILQALAVLVRPQALLYWPVLPAWALFVKRKESFREGFGRWFFVMLVSLLAILPWVFRNYVVHDAFVLIDTHGGWTLYGSYDMASRGEFVPKWNPGAAGLSEYEEDQLYYQLAFQFIRAHPDKALALIPGKVARMFSPIAVVEKEYPVPWAGAAKAVYALFLMPVTVGLILSTSNWRDSLLLYVNIFMNLLTAAVFYGCTRFSIPMQPAFAILAALAIVRLSSRARSAFHFRHL